MEPLLGHISDTLSSPQPSPGRPHTIRRGLVAVWRLLVLRDNWQGEACIAFFGAMGWALVAWHDPDDLLNSRQYSLLRTIMPERGWQILLLMSGTVQLCGLMIQSHVLRALGAMGVGFCFLCILIAFASSMPPAPGLTAYMACGAIELLAVVFHVAAIVRFKEYPA